MRDGLRGSDVHRRPHALQRSRKCAARCWRFRDNSRAARAGRFWTGGISGRWSAPEAEVKLYVTATDAVRAARRFAEMRARGEDVTEADVLAALRERDARDSQRAAAPLVAAEDAVMLDTTEMEIDEAAAQAIAVVERAFENPSPLRRKPGEKKRAEMIPAASIGAKAGLGMSRFVHSAYDLIIGRSGAASVARVCSGVWTPIPWPTSRPCYMWCGKAGGSSPRPATVVRCRGPYPDVPARRVLGVGC